MINNLKRLFDESLLNKERCRPGKLQSFQKFFARNVNFGIAYGLILFALYGIRMSISWTEEFPSGIPKPTQAKYFDFSLDIIEFLIAIAHQLKDNWRSFALLTGLAALVLKILRAWMIAKHVPCSGIHSNLDRLNFVDPGVVAALTSMLTLAAGVRPMEKPNAAFRVGEVFAMMQDYAVGLEHHEREQLVLSVLQSMTP